MDSEMPDFGLDGTACHLRVTSSLPLYFFFFPAPILKGGDYVLPLYLV